MKIWVALVVPFDFVESLKVFSTKQAAVEFANNSENAKRADEYGFGVDVYEAEIDGDDGETIYATGVTRDTA